MPDRAVIFDVDGVLVDSYLPHFESWRQLYSELGIPYSEADFGADFGRTSRDILARTLGDTLTDAQVASLDERKESLYREILRRNFPAMEGAVELIDALYDNGFLLAVGSSGPPENVALSLEGLGRSERFAARVTGQDVQRGKPDPQVFQTAASRLGLPPSHCLVVEDAPHGVEAALRAGMRCIAITGTANRAQLGAADLVVDQLREITPAIIRQYIDRAAGK